MFHSERKTLEISRSCPDAFLAVILARKAAISSEQDIDSGLRWIWLHTADADMKRPEPMCSCASAATSNVVMQLWRCCLPAPVGATAIVYRWVADMVGPATRRPI